MPGRVRGILTKDRFCGHNEDIFHISPASSFNIPNKDLQETPINGLITAEVSFSSAEALNSFTEGDGFRDNNIKKLMQVSNTWIKAFNVYGSFTAKIFGSALDVDHAITKIIRDNSDCKCIKYSPWSVYLPNSGATITFALQFIPFRYHSQIVGDEKSHLEKIEELSGTKIATTDNQNFSVIIKGHYIKIREAQRLITEKIIKLMCPTFI